MTIATAPGKIILVGEHAVVYGRPAIAVPVWQVVATAAITDGAPGRGCVIIAKDIHRTVRIAEAGAEEPLALVARLTLAALQLPLDPDWQIELRSQIPIASGLGSGAALSAALVRAIYAHVRQLVAPAQVSALVYESERLYHGTPSGIDNTVIAYGTPIWFVRGEAPMPFAPTVSFTLVIANSGIAAPTKETVGDVRRGWQAEPDRYEAYFDAIGGLVQQAKAAIVAGAVEKLGQIFDQNQAILHELGVSSAPLETLIGAARGAGALGAKLSGGGRGGNVIALVPADRIGAVVHGLTEAGALQVITTTVHCSEE